MAQRNPDPPAVTLQTGDTRSVEVWEQRRANPPYGLEGQSPEQSRDRREQEGREQVRVAVLPRCRKATGGWGPG